MDTTTTSSPPNNTLSLSALHHQSEPRHVHFQEHITIIPPPSLDSSNHNDNNDSEPDTYSTWYQWNELDAFRNDARELCREMRYRDTLVSYTVDSSTNSSSDSDSSASSSSTTARLPTMARSSLTRGLEQRSCDERQRRKYLATRFVLKIAPKLYRTDPEKLAEVSQKCNAWATELAKEEAARDYARVYHHVVAGKGDKKRSTLDCCYNNSETKRIRIQ